MALFSPVAQTKGGAARPAAMLQRACAGKTCGQCASCEKKKRMQRKPNGASANDSPQTYNAAPQLTQGGARLPHSLRGSLGSLYGSDLADVRIHDNATSHAAAREVGARAFTLGQHVHFAAGEYRPQVRDGLHLLAHELGHTLQQGHAEGADGESVEIGSPDSGFEREADAAADAIIAGRPAHIRAGTARGLQGKLLQRQLGTAAGGSESATVDRIEDENTVVHITRTVTERPCKEEAVTQATPSDKIFYWDKEANAIGLNYEICNGKVKLSTKGEINYDKVIESGKNLLTTLQKNPALGADLGGLLNERLGAATISATGDVTLTVDGILTAAVEGESTVGTENQKFNVRGVLKVTPKGMSFTITGGVDFSQTPLQKVTTYTLEGKAATKYFAVSLKYEQIDTSQVGGPSTNKGQVVGGLDVPLPDVGPLKDVTLGPTVTVDDQGKPTFGGGIKGRFGGPEKTPRVRCYKCDCPPPLPEYSCSKVVKPHVKRTEKEPAKDSLVKLHYNYNSAVPAEPKAFAGNIGSIAAMIGEGFKVEHIHGYASPEGSLDAPKPPVAGFKGNIELSGRRATHARAAIAEKAPNAALPEAEGKGEQLGDLDGTGDTKDKNITPQLVALLEPKTPEERLDALGVDDSVRNDPDKKKQALADVEAFIQGRDANGLKLGTRPRWEKVFPFLRRVEVKLHKEAVIEKTPVKGGTFPGCSDKDITYARANMPALPPQRRLPQERCGR